MDRFRKLKRIVYMIAGLGFMQLAILLLILHPAPFHIWASVAILAILFVFFITLSMGLINELKSKEK